MTVELRAGNARGIPPGEGTSDWDPAAAIEPTNSRAMNTKQVTAKTSRHVRPTALLPFWHLAGFALGAATAALGQRAAMACTVAVEETIDAHYTAQIDRLADTDAPLRDTLEKFRAEEREHRDIALANEAELAPGYRLLSAAIRTGCRIAIRLSERL